MTEAPLLTSWNDYAAAAEELLAGACHSVAIFDQDLMALRLERPAAIASITRLLHTSPAHSLRIVVRNASPLRHQHPQLMALLRTFAHNFHVVETPPHLAHLADAMLLADDTSALIRFHQDHARSKKVIGDAEACKPYQRRFDELWSEGGTQVSATTVGL